MLSWAPLPFKLRGCPLSLLLIPAIHWGPCCSRSGGLLSEASPLCVLQRTHSRITWALSHSESLCLALFSFLQSCLLPRCWCAFEFYPEHLILPDSQLLLLGGLTMPYSVLPYDIFFFLRDSIVSSGNLASEWLPQFSRQLWIYLNPKCDTMWVTFQKNF